jgi:DNA-binding CsgD family transcriptional regulator
MTIAYGLMLLISIVLLIVYCLVIKKKEKWLTVFFASICIVQLGYLLLSIANTVDSALVFNKMSYLGHISLLMSMFLNIVSVCGFKCKKVLSILLIIIGGIVFMLVCTSGYLPWYYKDVSLEYVDGASKLVKIYGPLHIVYLIYILFYFCLMIFTITRSIITKKVAEKKQAGLLISIVLCNILMWIIEKFIDWNFEFLSVSYILSECMLLFLYWMMQDYVNVKNLPVQGDSSPIIIVNSMTKAEKIKHILSMLPEGTTLSARQIDVLEGIIDGKSRKEIAADLFLSENTVKMHTSSLYRVLGVNNRDELRSLFKNKK